MANLLAAVGETSISPFATVVSYLFALVLVLFLAYASTKFLSRLNFGKIRNRHITLLDKFFISADKSLFLIRVEKRFYLISSDKGGLKVLDKLREEDLPSYGKEAEDRNEEGIATPKLGSFAEKLMSKRKN